MKAGLLSVQFGLYLIVGGLSSVVDVGGFVLLSYLGVATVVASPVSFLAGTTFNYFFSYILAFQRGRFQRREEIGRLLVVALVGLALNSGFVWLFISQFSLQDALAKTAAIPCVLAWNFLARRTFVFHKELPEPVMSRLGDGSGD